MTKKIALTSAEMDQNVPNLAALRTSLRAHFGRQWALHGQRHPIEETLDKYAGEHPELNAYQLKAVQYQVLAENMETVLFDDSPFYYVNDLCRGPQAGFPYYSAGGWLLRRNDHLCRETNPVDYDRYEGMKRSILFTGSGLYFDVMHYCFPITNVVENGLKYYYDKAEAALPLCKNEEERDFLLCAMAGLKAAKLVSERFGKAAAERMEQLSDPTQKKFMKMIADAAPVTPWEKPAHFYEGLNALWFCRNLLGEIDGIGNSHLGRPDLILKDLYDADIASGYMTKEEAYDLISRFLTHGDCEYDKDSAVLHQNDHELEMGYVLGGYDKDGNDVYNEITAMFIHAHRAQNLIYPKPHYRYHKNSCDEYLNDIAKDFLIGRSIGGLVNDDSIIPALVKAGKSVEDARCYINYGCWGIITEGMETVTGGNFVHMLSVMERTVYGDNDICRSINVHFDPMDDAQSFEEAYSIYYNNLIRMIRDRLTIIGNYASVGVKVNPITIYSACMDGCIENRRDSLGGGSKYVSNNFSLAEIANVVDGLLAIKSICFDQKLMSVKEFLDIVRNNWEGHEDLRQSLHNCPHYGDESAESTGLTKRIFESIYKDTRDIRNEFGTDYMIDLFVYQEFRFHAEKMKATPDGRKNGDIVALGVNPSRFHVDTVPGVMNSITAIDPVLAENHSLTLQLPAAKMTEERMAALFRAAQQLNMKHLQINCVDADTLLDAQKHPENHQDLVVRICGFSAKFVSLSPEWQDEFINRVMYSE